MTDAERERVGAYLRLLADRMGLRDWTVAVDREPAEDGKAAMVRCIPGRKVAIVRLDREWADQTPESLRQTCVHELMHCHHAAMREDVERRLRPLDYETFEMLFEYAIDGAAEAWAEALPLMLTLENEGLMGRRKTVKTLPDKTPAAQPKPKAGPKPSPKGKGK